MAELPLLLIIISGIGVVAFAVSGALAGVRAGMDWWGLTSLAAVTAIGGGTLRDVFLVRTPSWLIDFWPTVVLIAVAVAAVMLADRKVAVFFTGEVYALAALAGSIGFVLTTQFGAVPALIAGLGVTLTVRLGALAFGWRVPTLPTPPPANDAS